ncbi:WGR domain protein [Leptospira interrogans serovar Bataviae str. HAI135]|nr:WGR domain protein [Leptospira interrogans serovar Bataviae str. HAI135]
MNHHLTFKDGSSDKFWNIEVSGNSFTVTYGKTGTSGTSQTKTFDNEEKCLKEAQKLLSEKLKKGIFKKKKILQSPKIQNWKKRIIKIPSKIKIINPQKSFIKNKTTFPFRKPKRK